ncbi:MAG: flagellar FliJ family protein [candidate division Zixibacteria bacterium]|nr:flagellar FliJ family protein [candidate division Zixibacteria bacterium]MCK4605875.1 flagellar FliJ family protein [candidate division Zixibacteria bacterium]
MKKFKYRLEALLKLKEHIERERQKEHAGALHRVNSQKAALGQLDDDRKGTLTGQRQRMTSPLSVAEMLVYSRYLMKLKKDRLAGEQFLDALDKEAEKKRQDLVEASKQRQIHEKLKERQKEKHDQTGRLAMAKSDDEIAINSYRRRRPARP